VRRIGRGSKNIAPRGLLRYNFGLDAISNEVGWGLPIIYDDWLRFKSKPIILEDSTSYHDGDIGSKFSPTCFGLVAPKEHETACYKSKENGSCRSDKAVILVGNLYGAKKDPRPDVIAGAIALASISALVTYFIFKWNKK
jgi:hypothetical protein